MKSNSLLLTGAPITKPYDQNLLELWSLKIQHFPSQYFISVYENVDFQDKWILPFSLSLNTFLGSCE